MPPEKSDLTQSKSVQDFLKAVYSLQQGGERVSTNALAEGLAVAAPSITDMAQRLVTAGLIDYERYKGVLLTPTGEMVALKMVRRHRLIELYLVNELGYALQDVHDEAEKLEHAVSDKFVEAIAVKLGHPELDPHGEPIPSQDGTIVDREITPLVDWPLNTGAVVSRIKADDPQMLEHILERGFKLQAHVEILSRDPFDGPVMAMVDGKMRIVGHQVAACIMVEGDS
ncbi:MAG: metal-dependent transcriptional regulator [Chloroflexi bacterium]|nr:metal-dependent transcriptional regulator [Chloroflexota bacterium]MCC6892866.1 metal-dependent transcriptional regulator [Anaerolineae bacterium]